MGKVVYSRRARQNTIDIYQFYEKLDVDTADRAVQTIVLSLKRLAEHPKAGRPVIDSVRFRERIIPFGGQGFLALYEISSDGNTITIAAIRHQRQAGYTEEEY